MTYAADVLRVCVAVVFATAVHSKVRSRLALVEFEESLASVSSWVARHAHATAYAIIGGETACVLLLALDPVARLGFVIAGFMMAAFTVQTWRIAHDQRDVVCRCFGADGSRITARHVVRNLVTSGIVALGIFATFGSRGMTGEPAGGVVLAAACGAVLGVLVTRWDDLAFLLLGPLPLQTPVME